MSIFLEKVKSLSIIDMSENKSEEDMSATTKHVYTNPTFSSSVSVYFISFLVITF